MQVTHTVIFGLHLSSKTHKKICLHQYSWGFRRKLEHVTLWNTLEDNVIYR